MCILIRKPEREGVCYNPVLKTKPLQIRRQQIRLKGLRLPVSVLNHPIRLLVLEVTNE
jgi:hypothetical protein